MATVIGISGSYGGLNVGDEAILTSAIAELRAARADVEIVVFSRNAEHTVKHQAADRVVAARQLTKSEITPEIERLDLFLLGGGGILYDGEAPVYLRDVRIAQALGVPTMTYAISAGPLVSPEDRAMVRQALAGMRYVTVRDGHAKRLLEDVGIEHDIILTADPALLLQPEPFPEEMLLREGVPLTGKLVGIAVREPGGAAPELAAAQYHDLIANAADYMVERFDADILFVPMERDDIRHAHRVIAQMSAPHRGSVLRGHYSPREILGLMPHFDLAVGMRLHFVIFAALACVPVIALPYAPKVAGFVQRLDLPVRTPVYEERPGPLLALIDHLWDRRREAAESVRMHIGPLQDLARQTNTYVWEAVRRGSE